MVTQSTQIKVDTQFIISILLWDLLIPEGLLEKEPGGDYCDMELFWR